jgi:hypothetical protein
VSGTEQPPRELLASSCQRVAESWSWGWIHKGDGLQDLMPGQTGVWGDTEKEGSCRREVRGQDTDQQIGESTYGLVNFHSGC